mmetsp:Transcript_43323/g.49819  ORF Transcript_43323/g.49819 Transcript_43323/m.49819 type:complete len:250 (+) Transcript_43323:178-927(+)|eukprot:CAMPEP_0115005966 /NCGR_PEP_ID=MMETSP0216-20121206/20203_1 /TAXON_ID=223996 /ORGANISM="Protocruzia adherens, Strain Boccale" /LENGTH=249 /DNA_ID=CAMNT_0002372427 /DNA_START=44 /DNA_END=793 /DNA_ORIENTATION=-
MSRRYDSRTTTFTPQGRLMQVEYAIEAINFSGACIGVLSSEGVILATERKQTSKLLEQTKSSEKIYVLDKHIMCAVAGLTADANTLIDRARNSSQNFNEKFREPIPIEQLVQDLCNFKQYYTQHGGQRPFGTAFLYAGWDVHHGFQLYHSDPSGIYGGWKATSIGTNSQAANSILTQEYKEGCTLNEALGLVAKVMCRTMDTTSPSPDKFEIVVVRRDDKKVVHHTLKDDEVLKLLKDNELYHEEEQTD